MEENLYEFDYMIINVESCLNGSLSNNFVKTKYYNVDVKMDDAGRSKGIKAVAEQLSNGEKVIATIRYYGGYYTTNIFNRYGTNVTILEYDFHSYQGENNYCFNYWLYENGSVRLIKKIV